MHSNLYILKAVVNGPRNGSPSTKSLAFVSFTVVRRTLESCLYITFIFFFL